MKPCTAAADVIEYRMLAANRHAATASLFANGLSNTTLLQLARLATGANYSFSVYAVYREDAMTFEASGKVEVRQPTQSLASVLHDAIRDAEFLDSLLAPLAAQVRAHFAVETSSE